MSAEESAGVASGGGEDGGPDDATLVRQAQAGDRKAFDVLVNRYRDRVYGLIWNMVRNNADALDLTQDAFVKAWLALPRFEARSAFYTWLYRISHNVTYDWLRKRKIERVGEFDETIELHGIEASASTAPAPVLRPDERLRQQDYRDVIEQALGQLSADHRQVVLLREVQGLKYEEIAESMGCSTGTVMSRLFYARKKLQESLRELYEDMKRGE